MKRVWFGAGLLIVLLAVSLIVTWGMDRIHTPIAGDLQQAAACAQLGDWPRAMEYSQRAEQSWKKWEHFRACFADHTPTEEVSAELAAMNTARQKQETTEFAASCARAAKMVQAVGDAHALCWWNLL